MNSILLKVKHPLLYSSIGISDHTASKVMMEMLHTWNVNNDVVRPFYECVILFQSCIRTMTTDLGVKVLQFCLAEKTNARLTLLAVDLPLFWIYMAQHYLAPAL